MRRAERLFRLVDEMRARRISRAEDLALHFEVSIRTIYRDIAHLQASGLPIDGAAGIGFLLRPGFDLPALTFTHDQLEALALGLAIVESRGDPQLRVAAREVRARLQAGLPDPELRRLADAPFFAIAPALTETGARAGEAAGQIRRAIRRRQILRLSYSDGAGAPSERRVRPLAVWSLPDGWMFTAWCELRSDFRTFRFDRLRALSVLEEVFPEEPAKSLRAFMEQDRCGGPGQG